MADTADLIRRRFDALDPVLDEQARRRFAAAEARVLGRGGVTLVSKVTGNYACTKDIAALETRQDGPVEVFAPPPKEKEDVKPETLAERLRKRAKEPDAVKAWRERMTTTDAESVMQRRSRIELTNAHAKMRGLGAMLVRGLRKVQAVVVLHALAHNLTTAWRLRAARAAAAC